MRATQLAMLRKGPRLGIDPGLSGAIAVVDDEQCYDVRNMPRLGAGRGINGARVLEILDVLDPSGLMPVYCEAIGVYRGRKKEGDLDDADKLGAGMFAFYKSVGALELILDSMSARPVLYVQPATWKSKLGLMSRKNNKVPKNTARDVAMKILGPSAFPFCRSNTNAADACLIGYIGPQFDPRMIDEVTQTITNEEPF